MRTYPVWVLFMIEERVAISLLESYKNDSIRIISHYLLY